MGQSPSEFWTTTPRHFWWVYEAKKIEQDAINGKTKGQVFKKGEAKALRKWMDAHNASRSIS